MLNFHPDRKSERGQSLVLIALMIAGLVAFVGLALDGGQVYMMRRQMQNAADAGAFAGSRELSLAKDQLSIWQKINQYTIGNSGVGNGADSFEAVFLPGGEPVTASNIPAPANATSIQVTTHKNFQTLLLSFLGFSTLTASADAIACTGTMNSPDTPLWPIVVYDDSWTLGQVVTFDDQDDDSVGNFGLADFNGGKDANNDTSNWLKNGYSGPYSNKTFTGSDCKDPKFTTTFLGVPTCIEGYADRKDKWIAEAASLVGKEITILVYDRQYDTGKNARYHIVGFARFHVTLAIFGDKKQSTLAGFFLTYALPGQLNGGAKDYFLKAVKFCSASNPGNGPQFLQQGQAGTPTPTATPPAAATPEPGVGAFDTCGFPFNSRNPRTGIAFNESEVLRAFSPPPGGPAVTGQTIKVWYSDEHALTLGVRQINVLVSGNLKQTFNYPVTPLGSNPGSATNPSVGATNLNGDQAGTDPMDRPMFPALFITDITNDPTSQAGDWQYGGTPIAPHSVFGTWKAAVKTVDKTKPVWTYTTTPDADPSKNNWNLGPGSDPPPLGLKDEGYGAEVRWEVDKLGLISGHNYRLQFMVHDGDQNKVGGDTGENCTTIAVP